MIKLIVGFILGAVVATVGVNGVVKMSDKAFGNAQQYLKEQAK
jgi:hypothetical protein